MGLDLCRALVHVLRVLLDRRRVVAHTDQHGDHGQDRTEAASNLLVLRIHVLVHEDQDHQGHKGDQRDDRPELVLDEELERFGPAGRIVPVGRLPQQAAGNREDRDPDQDADQQRKVSVVERVPVEQDDRDGLAGDGDHPREHGENAKAPGGRLLALRGTPRLGDVGFFGWLIDGHVHTPSLEMPCEQYRPEFRLPPRCATSTTAWRSGSCAGLASQKAANLARDDRVSLAINGDPSDIMAITGLSMAARAVPVTDRAEAEKVLGLMPLKYPDQASLPVAMPTPDDVSLFRIEPEVVSVLDYTQGFGHSDLVAWPQPYSGGAGGKGNRSPRPSAV